MAYDERQAALEIARLLEQVRRLQAENERLQTENRQLSEKLDRLQKQVAEIERTNARQAAPFRREEKKKVPAGEKKRPGRKLGHRGACRAIPEHVDQEVEVPLDCCPHCQGAVTDRAPLVQWIEELPPLRPVVTRLTTWEANCPRCGAVRSTHPLQTSTAGGAASVQLGPRALAVAALLNKELGVTMRKTCRVLAKLLGMKLTPGGLSQALDG